MNSNDDMGYPGFLGTPNGDIKVYIPSSDGSSAIFTIGTGAK
jgi:hypothetical protein